jgi:hypothetical protein
MRYEKQCNLTTGERYHQLIKDFVNSKSKTKKKKKRYVTIGYLKKYDVLVAYNISKLIYLVHL